MSKKYNLYLDESGVANLSEYRSRFFIIAGVLIEEGIDRELTSYFRYIKRKYKLPSENNLHAVGLFEKKKSEFHLSAVKCRNFCESVAEFLKISPIEVMIICLDKTILRKIIRMPKGYKFGGSRDHQEDKEIGYEILTRKIFLEFGRRLKKYNGQGKVIAESRRGVDYRLLKTFLYCQEQNQFEGDDRLKQYSKELVERVYSISFENKKGLNGGLEMADLISYLFNQKVNRKINKLTNRGAMILWKAIEKKTTPGNLSAKVFQKYAKDRIDKIASRIKQRLGEADSIIARS